MIFTNNSDIVKFENGLYGYFRAINSGTGDNFITASDVMCDGFNAHVDFGNNFGGIHRMDAGFTPGDYYVESCWGTNYFAIKDYNIVIAGATNVEDATLQEDADYIAAEARFFRACSYLILARQFGKDYNPATAATDPCVPLVLEYNPNELPARATVQAVYDAIKADLDAAAAVLGTVEGEVAADYVNVDVINAMYARYYLDTEDYTKAAEYAEKVINSTAGYTLSASAADLYKQYVNDEGTEAIMQLYASQTEKASSRDYYASMSTTDKTSEGYAFNPYFLPTKKMIEAYNAADYRLAAWYSKGEYAAKIGGDYTSYDDFYVFTKYMGNAALESAGYPRGYNAIKPFLVSEFYLIAAEANLAAGNATAAKTALNALQTARNTPATEATAAEIQNEWFKETVGEGMRMTCLKRWGQGFNGRTPQDGALSKSAVMISGEDYHKKVVAADDFHFQWPVPSYEMKVNDNLEQNPGYTAE